MHGKIGIYIIQNIFNNLFNLIETLIACYNRVDMNDHVDVHFGAEILLYCVNDMMAFKNIPVSRNFHMHRSKAAIRSVIVYNQIMEPYNPFIAL